VADASKRPKKTTSSHLVGREGGGGGRGAETAEKNYLFLAFGCEGGGGGGRHIGTTENYHLRLAFEREGGVTGGGGRGVETTGKNHLRLTFGGEEGGEWWRQGGTCSRRRIRIALVGLDSPALVSRLSSSSSLLWVVVAAVARRCCIVIMHRRCGAVGVFHLRFVHYIGVGCKVVRMHHMGLPFHGSPLVPPPLSPVPSKHERNLPTSLKKGRGTWAGYAFDVMAHIPQERGGAGGGMFGTSPHPSGEGRGKKRALVS